MYSGFIQRIALTHKETKPYTNNLEDEIIVQEKDDNNEEVIKNMVSIIKKEDFDLAQFIENSY